MKINIEINVEELEMSIGGFCSLCTAPIEDEEKYYRILPQDNIVIKDFYGNDIDMICKNCSQNTRKVTK